MKIKIGDSDHNIAYLPIEPVSDKYPFCFDDCMRQVASWVMKDEFVSWSDRVRGQTTTKATVNNHHKLRSRERRRKLTDDLDRKAFALSLRLSILFHSSLFLHRF